MKTIGMIEDLKSLYEKALAKNPLQSAKFALATSAGAAIICECQVCNCDACDDGTGPEWN